MADNVCGPSTALKSFSEHTNRDRSLHQDRPVAVPGRPSPSNFRSLPAGPSNDAEVRAFAAGAPAGLQPEVMPMAYPMDLPVTRPPAFQSRMAHTPPMPEMYVPPVASAAGPVGHSGVHNNWVAEFSATQQGLGRASPAGLQTAGPTPNLAAATFGGLPQQQSMMIMQQPQQQSLYQQHNMFQQQRMQGSTLFNAYQPPPSYAPNVPLTQKHQSSATAGPAVADTGIAGLSEAELEARFAQIEADQEFQGEMDAWMANYGPSAEEEQAESQLEKQQQSDPSSTTSTAKAATTNEPSAVDRDFLDTPADSIIDQLTEEMLALVTGGDEDLLKRERARAAAVMRAEMIEVEGQRQQHEKQERQEKQRREEGNELARTAEQIVGVLDSHPASRFRESNFISLMRRIQRHEVVVRGDELIDKDTGEPVNAAANNKDGDADPSHSSNTNTESSFTPVQGTA